MKNNLERVSKCLYLQTIIHSRDRAGKFSPRLFCPKFFGTPLGSWTSAPSGHGRPHRIACFFPGFRGPDRSFCPRTSAGISAWTSTGYLAPKLTLWAACSFLRKVADLSVFTSGLTFSILEFILIASPSLITHHARGCGPEWLDPPGRASELHPRQAAHAFVRRLRQRGHPFRHEIGNMKFPQWN